MRIVHMIDDMDDIKTRINVILPDEQVHVLTVSAALTRRDRSALLSYLSDIGLQLMEERGELPEGTVAQLKADYQNRIAAAVAEKTR